MVLFELGGNKRRAGCIDGGLLSRVFLSQGTLLSVWHLTGSFENEMSGSRYGTVSVAVRFVPMAHLAVLTVWRWRLIVTSQPQGM